MIVFSKDPFWEDYPTDEAAFDKCVREGIYVHRDYERHIRVQSQYNGISSRKLERYFECWKSDRGKFIQERSVQVVKAMVAFERDYEKLDVDEVILYTSLPIAPGDYRWEDARGGLIFRYVYRLWHYKFGYMPGVE